MEVVLVMLLVAAVAYVVASPLRPGRAAEERAAEDAERADLEATRDAKYREIRDAELDFRTGKLSEADWRSQDRALKREAVEILRRLDALEALEGREAAEPEAPAGSVGDSPAETAQAPGEADPEVRETAPVRGAGGA